jgi:hypothetical protein
MSLGPTDFVALFNTIFADVAAVRSNRSLPPLVSAHLGKEQVSAEESPPRIVVIPTDIKFLPMRRMGAQPMTGKVTAVNPRPFSVRSNSSTLTFGATRRLRPQVQSSRQTSGTRSPLPGSSFVSFSARSCATAATILPSATTCPRSFDSRPIRTGWVGSSSCASRLSYPSLTSRGPSFRSRRPAAAVASRFLLTSRCRSPMAPARIRVLLSSREEGL